jgi:conflict system STAND superfamily ATPase
MSPSTLQASPYKGLEPFGDSDRDAQFFFGRERERDVIVANLMAARLTVLYGPSGVGKSSLLRAGVAHHLRERSRAGEGFAVVVFDVWSGDPADDLAAVIDAQSEPVNDTSAETSLSLQGRLEEWTSRIGGDVYLILDQFDEFFVYRERGRAEDFASQLPDIVTARGLRANVLISIREDAIASLDTFKARVPALFSNYLRLDHLDREAGRAAIVGPIARHNEVTGDSVSIEPELVEAVLDEVATGRVEAGAGGGGNGHVSPTNIEAAYLQVVMERLWEAELEAERSGDSQA